MLQQSGTEALEAVGLPVALGAAGELEACTEAGRSGAMTGWCPNQVLVTLVQKITVKMSCAIAKGELWQWSVLSRSYKLQGRYVL